MVKRRGRKKPVGWRGDSLGHSLAARGVETKNLRQLPQRIERCPTCKRLVDEHGVHLDIGSMSSAERAKMDKRIRKERRERKTSPIPEPIYLRWGEAEDEALKRHYSSKTARQIMTDYLPRRTTHQIRARARRLGLAESRKKEMAFDMREGGKRLK